MQRIAKLIFVTWIFCYVGLCYANTFNFTPVGSLPKSIRAGETVSAIYKITSVGIFFPGQYHILLALLSNLSNVSQDLTVDHACGVFPISPEGCNLKLNIVGPVSGPVKVCDDWMGRPGINCYIPSNPNDFLNVIAALSPMLIVSPTTTFLEANASQVFTITNTSTTTPAMGVTLSIPTNVQAQLQGPPVYTGCDSIAPLGTCTISINAVASPTPQSGNATVQGTNTANPAPTVAITIGAAPALIVSPPTTVLGANNTRVFIVANTSSTQTALNVTMTIPSNVQGQLIGLPVYTGCNSIAPLTTCTISITAVVSPTPQSGIATVQGTNTAVPAPTVAITIGAAPALTVSPPTTTLGPNDTQVFTVTNTSATLSALNVTMTIPPNVQGQLSGLPVYTGCNSIAPLGTCTISINAVAAPTAGSGNATVQGTNTAAPAPTVAITIGAAPALIVSPPTTVLGTNNTRVFIVANTSSTQTALNVTMTIPSNVQGQLIGLPVYTGCNSIAPLTTCTISITAVVSPTPQSGIATVQGTNTAVPAPTVAITIGAAPALTVSPPTTTLGPNDTQVFTVTNTSATLSALNITMTIPPNVQGQLSDLPVYTGCNSIAPLNTCTISITAVAAPTAQSGIATVQGTNTAAPATTAAITIGAAPVITVSPPTITLGPNETQIFTVTNTSPTLNALNITMTITPNAQGELTSLPVYTGCDSIAPLSTCTISITTVASPTGQSGTGTVQGTNTVAIAPVVSIFIAPPCTVLGNTTVTNTGSSVITGGVCVSSGTAITGFPPGQTVPSGQLHTNDSISASDHNNANTLYNIIAGLSCNTNLTGMDLGGMTLTPGVYCFDTSASLVAGGTLTLMGTGSATDTWYFQIGSTLITGANSTVTLTNGAVAGNVYWQIASSGTFGAGTSFQGQIVAFNSITIENSVNEIGRMWAYSGAITLDTDSIGP